MLLAVDPADRFGVVAVYVRLGAGTPDGHLLRGRLGGVQRLQGVALVYALLLLVVDEAPARRLRLPIKRELLL